MENYWSDIELKPGQTHTHQVGPVTIYLKKIANEIWVAHKHLPAQQEGDKHDFRGSEDETAMNNSKEDPGLDWVRWALKEDIYKFSFLPCFPDRPIVIKPDYPFKISKGAEARIYSRVPVFVRVVPSDYPDFVITEIPTVILSNTWFGAFTEGQLCYWLPTTARRSIDPEMFEQHMAVCTMQIKNNSQEELKFENICLKVERLSLYAKDEYLWADQSDITFQGEEKNCDIEMKGRLPVEAEGGKLITGPRTPIKKGFAELTFQRLKEFHPLGLIHS